MLLVSVKSHIQNELAASLLELLVALTIAQLVLVGCLISMQLAIKIENLAATNLKKIFLEDSQLLTATCIREKQLNKTCTASTRTFVVVEYE